MYTLRTKGIYAVVNRAIAVTVAAAALVLAPLALAGGREKPGSPRSSGTPLSGETIMVGGPVTGIVGTTITLHVEGANAAGRSYVGLDLAVDVSGARFAVRDADGDGTNGLDDISVNELLAVGANSQPTDPVGGPIKADVVVSPSRGGTSSGTPPAPTICQQLDSAAAQARLSPAQHDAIQAACEALKLAITNAVTSYRTTVATLHAVGQAAKSQLEATCRQAGYDSDVCKQARQQFRATTAGLLAQLASAEAAERSAFATALQQFHDAVNSVLGGQCPSSPSPAAGTSRK